MKQHALSAAFPSMPDHDFDALVDDIKKHGLREPVIVFDGMVLDGWHRYRACEAAGKKCVTQKFEGGDPIAFVLSRNLHRRHLTGSQRAAAIVEAMEWRAPGGKPEPGSGCSESEMARAADVSDRTIRHAKVAHEAGLGEAVKEGKVSAKAAAEVAGLPQPDRKRAVRAIESGKPIQKPEAEDSPLEKARCEIEELKEALSEAREDLERLSAIESGEQGDLIKRLQAELRAVKSKRDDVMRENVELRNQIKILQRQGKRAA